MATEQPDFKMGEQVVSVSNSELQKRLGTDFIARLDEDADFGALFGFWPRKPWVVRRYVVETWKIKTLDKLSIVNKWYILDRKNGNQRVYLDSVIDKEVALDPTTGKPISNRRGHYSRNSVRTPQLSIAGVLAQVGIDLEQLKLA
jgi:hypothetical protein